MSNDELNGDSRVRPDPDVVDTGLEDDCTALLHLGQKKYYTLNATGTRVWRKLKTGASLREISLDLQDRYEVESERADTSVARLVRELLVQGLVVSGGSTE